MPSPPSPDVTPCKRSHSARRVRRLSWVTSLALSSGFGLSAQPLLAEPAVVAVVAPLSGPQAALGDAIRTGVEAARALATTSNGNPSASVAVRFLDDSCRADAAEATARRLASEPADARPSVVIGHPCGSASAAAARIYAAAGMLFLSLSRHPAALPKAGGLAPFRLAGRDDRQAEAIAAHARAAPDARPIAIVHDRTTYASAIARDLEAALARSGAPAALTEGIVAGDKDYSATLERALAAGAGTMVFAGFPSEAAVLARAIHARAPRLVLIATDAVATEEFTRLAGDAAEGVRVALPDMPRPEGLADPESNEAETAQAAPPPTPAELATRAAHLAMTTWLSARAATGSRDAHVISTHLLRQGGTPTRDAVVFDQAREAAIPSFAIHVWRDGRLQRAKP